MEQYVIKGGIPLVGDVEIGGAKNAALAILAAASMTDETVYIDNLPDVRDINALLEALDGIGAHVKRVNRHAVEINGSGVENCIVENESMKKIRASYYLLGALLGKYKRAEVPLPGGCNIGSRPVDLHLKGFNALGIESEVGYGYVEAKIDKLHGNRIYLDFPSVGATENIMMAAVLAPGVTVIENAAEEPEIWDLARFLNCMGANIEGAGYGKITIHGVSELKQPKPFTPIFDRIEAGTFMVAAGITNSKITINGVNEEHLMPTIEKLKECGVYCTIDGQKMIVDGTKEKRPVDIKTMPYPGFPTDMQAQMMALLAITKGVSVITETVFENRFMHVGELGRMGANIKIDGRIAIVEGVTTLTGCGVKATDLRAGAALVIAALAAEGISEIDDIEYIQRGYEDFEGKLSALGAVIARVDSERELQKFKLKIG